MRRLLFLATLLVSAASAHQIVPPPNCGITTLAVLLGGGCSIGPVSFLNFSYTPLTGNSPNPNQITVTGQLIGNITQLSFTSPAFAVGELTTMNFVIGYAADPHPILFESDDILETSTPTNGGLARITTSLCIGSTFPGCAGGVVDNSLLVQHDSRSLTSPDSTFFPLEDFVDVRHTFLLQAPSGGTANFDAFRSRMVFDAAANAAGIPEPATLALTGAGLIGVVLVRRRRT